MDLRIATLAERPAMKSRFVNEETEPGPRPSRTFCAPKPAIGPEDRKIVDR